MYCIINPNLFKPFQSRKIKITPQFADDWKIVPEKYNYSDDITIYSEKLDTKVAGFKVYDFLRFLENYNVKMEGLKIQGEWIPGQDRKLYSKEDYNKWMEKYGKLVEGKISLKDIDFSKRGTKYKFKCGAEYYFLGFIKYKGKKVRLFGNKGDYSFSFEIIKDNKKLSQELNETINEKDIEFYFAKFFESYDYKEDMEVGEWIFEKWYDKDLGIVDNRFFIPEKNIREMWNYKDKFEISISGYINEKYYSTYDIKTYLLPQRDKSINLDEIFDIEWKFENNKFYYKFFTKKFLSYFGEKIKENKELYKELYEKYCKSFKPFEYDIFYKKVINFIK